MTVTSIHKDFDNLTLTVVADFDAPTTERAWQLWADRGTWSAGGTTQPSGDRGGTRPDVALAAARDSGVAGAPIHAALLELVRPGADGDRAVRTC